MNDLAILLRLWSRHPRFALINLGGLALGIAVFLILILFVRFETGFDRVLPGSDSVWVVERTVQFEDSEPVDIHTELEMLPLLKADFPDVEGSRMLFGSAAVQSGGEAVRETVALADPAFFDLFPLKAIDGDARAALARPDGAVITQSAATRRLGPGNPIGKTLTLTLGEEKRTLQVIAVIEDFPPATTYRPQILAGFLPDQPAFFEGSDGLITFLQFANDAKAKAFSDRLGAFIGRHPDPNFRGPADSLKVRAKIVPLASKHLEDPRARLVVTTLGIVGLITLVLAIINYVNLATARADLRAREVAIRKVAGAPRKVLIRQFLGEALVAATLAGIVGLALAELALPFVNAAGGLQLDITYFAADGVLPVVGLVILVTALAAGLYPAFVLSHFRPAAVLGSARSPGTGRQGTVLRESLVVGQFAIAIALMICTTVLFAQVRHIQTLDLGFDRESLIVIPSFSDPNLDPAQRENLRRSIAALDGVTGTTTSTVVPTGGSFGVRVSTENELPVEIQLFEGEVGPYFGSVYGIRLAAGRMFDPIRHPADLSDFATVPEGQRSFNILINRAAATALGFGTPEDAVGKDIVIDDRLSIIGVIENIQFENPTDDVMPFAYYLREGGGSGPRLSIRHAGNPRAVLKRIESVWQQQASGVPFEGQQVDDMLYDAYFKSDVQRSRLFGFGAALAIVVGLLGLYGLSAFNMSRRVREIGIRKALGATSAAITRLFVTQFMWPVLIANLIAWPLAWWAMTQWLSDFAERIDLSPLYFIAASLVAIVIAVMTVLLQSWRASRISSAEALRQE